MNTVIAFIAGGLVVALAVLGVKFLEERRGPRRAAPNTEENRVRTVSQILHLVIQGSPTGVTVVSRGGDVILSNARAHEMSIVHDLSLIHI